MQPLEIGDGCQLRLLEEADAGELHGLIDANRRHLSVWLPWAGGQTLEETAAFIRLTREQESANSGFQAAIVCEGAIAGAAGFHSVSWQHRSTRIGYWLASVHQGRGLATRAVQALVDHAFAVWDLHRVEIRAAPENTRSRAIPERLGFRQEGTLRQAERVGERYLDSVVYGLLAPEWAGR